MILSKNFILFFTLALSVVTPFSNMNQMINSAENDSTEVEVEKRKICRFVEEFPWLEQYHLMAARMIDVQIDPKHLGSLMSTFRSYVKGQYLNDVSKCNRGYKLKKTLMDAINFYHSCFREYKTGEKLQIMESTKYLDIMSELMTYCVDLEINYTKKMKELNSGTVSRVISSLKIFLDHSVDHILDSVLKLRNLTKKYTEITTLILQAVLENPQRIQYPLTYSRYLILYKVWKRLVSTPEERRRINHLAADSLPLPPGFRDKQVAGFLKGILPKIPRDRMNSATLFFMEAKLNVKEIIKKFLVASEDPRQKDFNDFSQFDNTLTNNIATESVDDLPDDEWDLFLSSGSMKNEADNINWNFFNSSPKSNLNLSKKKIFDPKKTAIIMPSNKNRIATCSPLSLAKSSAGGAYLLEAASSVENSTQEDIETEIITTGNDYVSASPINLQPNLPRPSMVVDNYISQIHRKDDMPIQSSENNLPIPVTQIKKENCEPRPSGITCESLIKKDETVVSRNNSIPLVVNQSVPVNTTALNFTPSTTINPQINVKVENQIPETPNLASMEHNNNNTAIGNDVNSNDTQFESLVDKLVFDQILQNPAATQWLRSGLFETMGVRDDNEQHRLHDVTFRRDFTNFIRQHEFRSRFCLEDITVDDEVPDGMFHDNQDNELVRCECQQCSANKDSLITNFQLLSDYKVLKTSQVSAVKRDNNQSRIKVEDKTDEHRALTNNTDSYKSMKLNQTTPNIHVKVENKFQNKIKVEGRNQVDELIDNRADENSDQSSTLPLKKRKAIAYSSENERDSFSREEMYCPSTSNDTYSSTPTYSTNYPPPNSPPTFPPIQIDYGRPNNQYDQNKKIKYSDPDISAAQDLIDFAEANRKFYSTPIQVNNPINQSVSMPHNSVFSNLRRPHQMPYSTTEMIKEKTSKRYSRSSNETSTIRKKSKPKKRKRYD